MINFHVPCNNAIAEHESIQVGTYRPESQDSGYSLGLLGIINGLFGVDEEHYGFIGMEAEGVDENYHITRIKRFVDRRK